MSERLSVDEYVQRSLESLGRSLPGEKIMKAYSLSVDTQKRIAAKQFTEQAILQSFKSHLDPTRGPHLVNLHTVGKAFAMRCQKHVAVRRRGMSYSHLLYAMQKAEPDEIRKLLSWSMENGATMNKLRIKARCNDEVRPSIQIARLRRYFERMDDMLGVLAGDEIVAAIRGVDPTRRLQAGRNLVAIWKCLNKTIKGNKLGKASHHLEKLLKNLGEID